MKVQDRVVNINDECVIFQALEESHATPPEGLLRRSSRRSKRLFNTASIEQDETEASEDEQSSPSIEGTAGGSLRRTRVSLLVA